MRHSPWVLSSLAYEPSIGLDSVAVVLTALLTSNTLQLSC